MKSSDKCFYIFHFSFQPAVAWLRTIKFFEPLIEEATVKMASVVKSTSYLIIYALNNVA